MDFFFFWIKWHIVCLDKENGGLRVCKIREFNLTLLEKWCWRFHMVNMEGGLEREVD